jgi:hypothetical protein
MNSGRGSYGLVVVVMLPGLLGGVCFVFGASRAVMAGSRSRLRWGTWAGAHDVGPSRRMWQQRLKMQGPGGCLLGIDGKVLQDYTSR